MLFKFTSECILYSSLRETPLPRINLPRELAIIGILLETWI